MDKTFVGLLSLGVFVGFLVSLILRHRYRLSILRAQTDFQRKLLDRLHSAEELRSFLESGAAYTMISSLAGSPQEPRMRMLGALVAGCVMAASGAGVLLFDRLAPRIAHVYDSVRPVFVMAGYVCFLGGVGFLIAAVITYRLVRSWESQPDQLR